MGLIDLEALDGDGLRRHIATLYDDISAVLNHSDDLTLDEHEKDDILNALEGEIDHCETLLNGRSD